MKKIILTVITICTFIIINAQEKANHNTTRSNLSASGIMVKEDGRDNDCDGVIDSKLFVKTTSGTPDLNMHCCNGIKKSWEGATAQAVKEASKKAHVKKHLFTNNGVTYYYNGDLEKLNKCRSKLGKRKWEYTPIDNTSATKRKRNKNFNRKGERVKRTKF